MKTTDAQPNKPTVVLRARAAATSEANIAPSFRNQPSHPPTDARVRNPLSGTSLYQETASRIENLFDVFAKGESPLPPGQGVVTWGEVIAASSVVPRKVKKAGRGIRWIAAADAGVGLVFRLLYNNITVMEWTVVNLVQNYSYGQDVSPFAGPATINNITGVGMAGIQPTYMLEFDEVQIFNTSGSDIRCNALILNGGARVLS